MQQRYFTLTNSPRLRHFTVLALVAVAGSVQLASSVAQHEVPKRDPMDAPLVTDRPDFTESTDAVPTGHVQLEVGYTFSYDSENAERFRNHTAPEILVRIGLRTDFELRIGWEGYTWGDEKTKGATRGGRRATREDSFEGSHDLSIGFKQKLLEQDGVLPHFGIIAAVSVPTGSTEVSSGDVDPQLVLLWAYDISDTFVIAGNVGFAAPTNEGDRFFQVSASLSFAWSLTDRVGTYIEYFGFYPNVEHSDAAHALNGGFTYLLDNNFQIDARIGIGLNEEADDFFTGVGFAWRF